MLSFLKKKSDFERRGRKLIRVRNENQVKRGKKIKHKMKKRKGERNEK